SPQTASLSGAGTAPGVSLSPTSVSFGNQQVNTTSAAQAVTLTNNGSSALSTTDHTTELQSRGDLAYTNNCDLRPSTLAASASCTVNVTFTPTATGTRRRSLPTRRSSDLSPQTASLSGAGTAPGVSLSPTSVSFGNQQVNTTSAAQAVTLTNNGSSAL